MDDEEYCIGDWSAMTEIQIYLTGVVSPIFNSWTELNNYMALLNSLEESEDEP